jgi:hypothetical protein
VELLLPIAVLLISWSLPSKGLDATILKLIVKIVQCTAFMWRAALHTLMKDEDILESLSDCHLL